MNIFHQRARRTAAACAAVLAAVGVASCGGGDPYTGLWEGTLDGQRPASAIVLGDGTYYLKYAGTATTPGGLVRGTGDFRGATFTSTDGVDFHFAYPPQRPTPASAASSVDTRP